MSATEPITVGHRILQSGTRARASHHWLSLAFGGALSAGTALRLWQLAAKPDWQYDEGVYTRVATNLLQHGTLSEHITVNTPWQPFLYQPPFYFTVLARWFALTGPSIYHARIFGVLCSVVTLAMLHRIVLRVHGPRVALFVMLPVIFDGWLLYIQRCSYIENPLLMLVTAGHPSVPVGPGQAVLAEVRGGRRDAWVRGGVQAHRRVQHRGRRAVLADPAP